MFSHLRARLHWLARVHFYAFFTYLDPVQTELSWICLASPSSQQLQTRLPLHYLCALVSFLLVLAYGVLGLPYLETGRISVQDIASSNQMMFHQVSSPTLRPAFDMLMASDISLTISSLLVRLLYGHFPDSGRLHLARNGRHLIVGSGRSLSNSVTVQILRISRLGRCAVRLLILFLAIIIYTYNYLNLFLLNDFLVYSPVSLLFWLTLFPLHFVHVILCISCGPILIMMTSAYLTVQQKQVLGQLKAINGKLRKVRPLVASATLATLIARHSVLHRRAVAIAQDTATYSRLFAPHLAVIFPYYIFGGCYLLKLVVFPSKVAIPFRDYIAFLLVFLQFVSALSTLIKVCARVVTHFDGMLRENGHFYQQLLRGRHWRLLSCRGKLQMEGTLLSRQFSPYTFRLSFSSTRITSKTFSAMLSYISVVFMFIYKN